jgi:putative DNA primase/helicase
MVRQNGDKRRMFNLVTDLELLHQKIKEIGNVVLIIIDPVSAYLGIGKVDSYRTTDVRGVLGPLKELAEEKMVSIVGVMHFNKKTDVHEAILRIADSLAYVAAARHCFVVLDDAENNRRLFVKAKNNVAPDMAALSYTIDTKSVGTDPELKTPIVAPYVVWGTDHVTITATEAMQAEAGGKSNGLSSTRETAKQFLSQKLATGPVLKSEIDDEADANNISKRTLERAKTDLGIIAKKGGYQGAWTWELPAARPSIGAD